jgi:hypothetical protein
MATIINEWRRIVAQIRVLSKATGVKVPEMFNHLEGNVYARQGRRLSALADFLSQVNATLEKKEQPAKAKRGKAK